MKPNYLKRIFPEFFQLMEDFSTITYIEYASSAYKSHDFGGFSGGFRSNAQAVIANHAYAYGKKLCSHMELWREARSKPGTGIHQWFIINDYLFQIDPLNG